MKRRAFLTLLMLAVLCLTLTGCSDSAHKKDLLLHLAFDEGSGVTVKDSAEKLPDTELSYGFSHAAYMDDQEPQWRSEGISGGCLLLDGTST